MNTRLTWINRRYLTKRKRAVKCLILRAGKLCHMGNLNLVWLDIAIAVDCTSRMMNSVDFLKTNFILILPPLDQKVTLN